jgi:hypothetical protein
MAFRQKKAPTEAGAKLNYRRDCPRSEVPTEIRPRDAAKFNSPLWLICDELKKAKPPVMRKPTALRG